MGVVYKRTPAMWHYIFKNKATSVVYDIYCSQMYISDSEYICKNCLYINEKELRFKTAEYNIILHDYIPETKKTVLEH